MRNYNFGRGKWVFIDWLGIEPGYGTCWSGAARAFGYCVPRGVELCTHAPDVVQEFCLPIDRPWEKGFTAYATFLADGGVFRCWYEHGNGMAYAESDDGVVWRKPNLGLRELNGSTANNLLGFGMHGAGVFIDSSAPPAERYKMVGCLWTPEEKAVVGAVSPDGLHWTPLPDPVLRHNHADTQNIGLYDSERGQYVLYTRQTDGVMQRRGVNRAITNDFRRFEPSEPVLECSPLDSPDWDIYCNGYAKWPGASGAHVMRLSIFKHTPDLVDVHLRVSRDGVIWHRPQGNTPWINGGPSYPNPYPSVYACAGILPTGHGEWSTYVGTAHHAHNEPIDRMTRPAGILRARMREDGFMSLSSDGPGEFWTIPFVLNSDTIRLNVKTRFAGHLRAELLASSGGNTGSETTGNDAIAGFALADCTPVGGDHIAAPLTWRGGVNLDALRGRTVRLHVDLFKADFYAIAF